MKYNPRIDLLYKMAERFDFSIDTRGVWPIMVDGVRAAEYRTHRDAINFVARSETWHAMNSGYNAGEE